MKKRAKRKQPYWRNNSHNVRNGWLILWWRQEFALFGYFYMWHLSFFKLEFIELASVGKRSANLCFPSVWWAAGIQRGWLHYRPGLPYRDLFLENSQLSQMGFMSKILDFFSVRLNLLFWQHCRHLLFGSYASIVEWKSTLHARLNEMLWFIRILYIGLS